MIALPDVNVLVALLWESHIHHGAARRWFRANGAEWATCSITQTGFVRVSSNPRVSSDALAVQEACAVLASLCQHPQHRFLTDSISFADSEFVHHERLVGYRQVTDAHLVAVARSQSARVVTFDQGIENLVDTTEAIEVLQG
jgi:toxin-antitoxin system PIN domain toxin